jgi:CRISPR-associated RAMP protein (TIGR02581 family)
MFDTFKNRLELTGTLTTVTGLKVGAGRSVEPTDPDVPVMKDVDGRPLIPGSSFKGAMRSRLEAFLRGVNPRFANDPSELASFQWMNQVKAIKEATEQDSELTEKLLAITDKASCLFGSPWLAGKLQIRDLTVSAENWFGQYQERDGVAIDRDTETAADKRKYDFEVVPAGTLFSFKAIAENVTDAELGLLMLGITQFENEMIPLGGANSRGLGVVRLELDEIIWINPQKREKVLEYMQDLVAGTLQKYILTSAEIAPQRSEWSEALIDDLSRVTA